MTQADLIVAAIDALNEAAVPYLLAGSVATNAYSIPRSTKDADFVVEMNAESLAQVSRRLEPLFELDPQQHLETTTWTRRYILKARTLPFEVELFLKSTDPHHQEQWQRRREIFIAFLNRSTFLPTPEDIIIQKVRWGRPKDLADAGGIMSVRGKTLDWSYIERWCDAHHTRQRLETVKASIPADLIL
jgi:hypothetical protein